MSSVRLHKAIADSGYLSRRKAEQAIAQGRVRVNGQLVTELGTKIDPASDKVQVDGKDIECQVESRVLIFHKPRQVMTTKSDPEGRKTVMSFFPPEFQSFDPVGRLDYDSEGLLLLTNDGNLANRLMHPRYEVAKRYWTWVEGEPFGDALERLTRGVILEDGPGRFDSVQERRGPKDETYFEIVVSEGRNRFVRRMWEAVGYPVHRLMRVGVGEIELGALERGTFREITPAERRYLESIGEGR